MTKNQKKDRYSGLALLLFGLALYFFMIPYTIQIEDTLSNLGSDFFPKLMTILLIILSLILILNSFKKERNSEEEINDEGALAEGDSTRPWAAVIVFALMIVFIYIVEPLGFIVSASIIMLSIMAVLLARKWYLYVIMIAIIFILKYVFENIMYIQLP